MEPSSAPEAPPAPPSLSDVARQLAFDFKKNLGPGDVADLRRLRPAEPPPPAFWRLVALRIEPTGQLDPTGHGDRDEAERRWAVVLSSMASLGGDLLARGRTLGRALAAGGVSEPRVLRLLRAHDKLLWRSLRAAVHQLVSAGEAVDPADLAWLVHSDGESFAETVRRRIARDYFRSLASAGSPRKETSA